MNGNQKILNSLWIIVSFIVFFNGLGFVYIGSKTRNEKWIMEGCIYEIPWFLLLLGTGLFSNEAGTFIAGIGLLLVLASIIRSFLVNPRYHEALSSNNYRKSKSRFTSLLFFILSAIPIINGIPMIIYGYSNSDRDRIIEGVIYEIPWVLLFITVFNDFLSNIFVMIGLILNLLSIIRSIMVNYEIGPLSENAFYENTKEETVKTPIMREPPVSEGINENEDSPYKDKLPEINQLSEEFKAKESKVSQLVEKRFKSSELSYDRFKSIISSADENFSIQRDSALEIVNLASHRNEKLDSELSKRIDAMKSILEKVNQLIEALVIDSLESREAEEDLKELVDDMEDLINSVQDYN